MLTRAGSHRLQEIQILDQDCLTHVLRCMRLHCRTAGAPMQVCKQWLSILRHYLQAAQSRLICRYYDDASPGYCRYLCSREDDGEPTHQLIPLHGTAWLVSGDREQLPYGLGDPSKPINIAPRLGGLREFDLLSFPNDYTDNRFTVNDLYHLLLQLACLPSLEILGISTQGEWDLAPSSASPYQTFSTSSEVENYLTMLQFCLSKLTVVHTVRGHFGLGDHSMIHLMPALRGMANLRHVDIEHMWVSPEDPDLAEALSAMRDLQLESLGGLDDPAMAFWDVFSGKSQRRLSELNLVQVTPEWMNAEVRGLTGSQYSEALTDATATKICRMVHELSQMPLLRRLRWQWACDGDYVEMFIDEERGEPGEGNVELRALLRDRLEKLISERAQLHIRLVDASTLGNLIDGAFRHLAPELKVAYA